MRNSLKKLRNLVIPIGFGCCLSGAALAAPFGYTSDGDSGEEGGAPLLKIDMADFSVTEIGPITGVNVEGSSFGPNDVLYVTDDQTNKLYTVDLTTGAPTEIGVITVGGNQLPFQDPGMAFCPDNSTMYLATEQGNLYSLDLSTAVATPIGNSTFRPYTALSCGRDGTLWAVADGTTIFEPSSKGTLLTIDRTTGAATKIADLNIGGVAIDINDGGLGDDGTRLLLVLDEETSSTSNKVYSVDRVTGALTVLGALNPAQYLGLESLALDVEARPSDCSTDGLATLSQGGWANKNSPINSVWPGAGLYFGSSGHSLTLTTANAAKTLLQSTGTPAVLTTNWTNPTLKQLSNTLASQTVAAELNSYWNTDLATLIIQVGPYAGKTVTELLEAADTALGTPGTLKATLSDLTKALDQANRSFEKGVSSGFLGCSSTPE